MGRAFGLQYVLSAVGVDRASAKHILSIELGATENTAAMDALFTRCASCLRNANMFVNDGAKSLRAVIKKVLGAH